ncbi:MULTISPECIES: helix-turn-helix transcriptional regulator [unclassified Beijerinckia]|uniref:helix-turn-helix transcriptional regulator n=1 Tax=unclassified Beijerinckia TaxID=2638183 RepID=UPI000897DEB8|nr:MULTISPECIES: helix-turn-helix transcriptional regulator [unclassified Beijerinckia]MDH7799302.1 DNA-binding CsgD family transcriptional regulator [Beijerinckia sp. GAS462]SED45511.1 DNA-binding transcriptional regulator, CsgD family [Beijerinckia sp. 28-YEA-48]
MAQSFSSFDDAAQSLLDAAVDPMLWNDAMARVASFAGATGAMLIHTKSPRPVIPYSSSIAEAIEGYFREGWNHRDERVRGLPFMRRNGFFVDQDYLDRDELKTSPYYRYLQRFQINWAAGIGVSTADEELALMIYFGDRHGFVDRKKMQSFMRLRPHIEAAALLSKNIAFANASGMIDAYQSLRCPSLLLDTTGVVIKLNQAAEDIIDDGLKLKHGIVSCERAEDTQSLKALISQICGNAGLAHQDVPLRLVVQRTAKGPLIVEGMRIEGMASAVFSSARAILLITDPSRTFQPTPAMLMRNVFGLTATEAMLVSHLEQGMALQAAADAMRISVQTARTHLKSVFFKTNTNRQSELLLSIRRLRQVV